MNHTNYSTRFASFSRINLNQPFDKYRLKITYSLLYMIYDIYIYIYGEIDFIGISLFRFFYSSRLYFCNISTSVSCLSRNALLLISSCSFLSQSVFIQVYSGLISRVLTQRCYFISFLFRNHSSSLLVTHLYVFVSFAVVFRFRYAMQRNNERSE